MSSISNPLTFAATTNTNALPTYKTGLGTATATTTTTLAGSTLGAYANTQNSHFVWPWPQGGTSICGGCGGMIYPNLQHVCTTTATAWGLTTTQAPPQPELLNRYHERVHCKKCDLKRKPKIKYCDGNTLEVHIPDHAGLGLGCRTRSGYKEHLHLSCHRCGYTWLMLTADQEVEPDDGEGDL